MRRVFVANRGEIALRVFRACRDLGLEAVAAVAPDDRGPLHAREADAVAEVPSYLDAAALVARGAESRRRGCAPRLRLPGGEPGLRRRGRGGRPDWIGPPPEALRLGGDKLAAKRIAREEGVPVLPEGEPDEIGFPLVIKAAAGGGGRGMRVVRGPAELADALEAAQREAEAAFGDDRVFCERYVERPRHVEIQLLADAHGTVVALGERECSVQRRHQKVLEESPSPALDPGLRTRMEEAAVAFARAIGYRARAPPSSCSRPTARSRSSS